MTANFQHVVTSFHKEEKGRPKAALCWFAGSYFRSFMAVAAMDTPNSSPSM